MKGFGSRFEASRKSWMAWINCSTLEKVPRRSCFSVSSRNHLSTKFNRDELVGVKCN